MMAGEERSREKNEKKIRLQSMIRRTNVERLRVVSLLFGLIDFCGLIGSIFVAEQGRFYGRYTSVLFSLCIINACFCAISVLLLEEEKIKNWQNAIILYWGCMAVFAMLQLRGNYTPFYVVLFATVIVLALSIIPLLTNQEFILLWIGQMAVFCAIAFAIQFSMQEWYYFLTIEILAASLSRTIYLNTLRSMDVKLALKAAVVKSETDPLSGLMNRRGLEHFMEHIWPYVKRNQSSVAAIMLDIDFFKKYNDTYGHQQGDCCIKLISDEVNRHVRRKTDVAARIGGEEFVVFLTGLEAVKALDWSIQLKQDIETLQIPHSPANFLPYVTVSMGLCWVDSGRDINYSEVMGAADKCLYEAKRSGRACLVYEGNVYGACETTPAYIER